MIFLDYNVIIFEIIKLVNKIVLYKIWVEEEIIIKIVGLLRK